jgi:hypothetical protein
MGDVELAIGNASATLRHWGEAGTQKLLSEMNECRLIF